jgi:hypothetical protein
VSGPAEPAGHGVARAGAWRFWLTGWKLAWPNLLPPDEAAQRLAAQVRASGFLQLPHDGAFVGFINPKLIYIEHRIPGWFGNSAFNPVFYGKLVAPAATDSPHAASVLSGRFTFRANLKVGVMLALLIGLTLVLGPLVGTIAPRLPGAAVSTPVAAGLMSALAALACALLLWVVRAAVEAARERVAAMQAMIAQTLPPAR